jgi:uncharacterized protein with FMN-binding domain
MKKRWKLLFGLPIGVIVVFGAGLLSWFAFAPIQEPVGGPVDSGRLHDGVFEGEYRDGPNRAEVAVTIEDGHIVDIDVKRNVASWIGKKANPAVPRRIVAQQSTVVDAVTGATHSSNVIMNAVEKAVRKSYAASEGR